MPMPQSLRAEIALDAARESIETSQRVNENEWIRRAIRERLVRRKPSGMPIGPAPVLPPNAAGNGKGKKP